MTLAVLLPFGGAAIAQSDDPPPSDVYGHLDDDADQAVVFGQVDQSNGVGALNVDDPEVTVQVIWTPACEVNSPATPGTVMCPAAASLCVHDSGSRQILMWKWTRLWNRTTGRSETPWSLSDTVCLGVEDPVTGIHGQIERLFQDRVKLMKAPLHIQPPNGRTLVNVDTIFWTSDPARTFVDIPILGYSVDLRILPTQYTWRFGDATQSQTTTPGGPYPSKDVAHRYSGIGGVRPSLAVTYRGQYRVDAGSWIDMVGTATVDGPEVELTVVETRAQLIGG